MEKLEYRGYEVSLHLGHYHNGNIFIEMRNHNDDSMLECTVNMEMELAEGEAFIRQTLLSWFKENGFVEKVIGKLVFDDNIVPLPIVKLDTEKLEEVI